MARKSSTIPVAALSADTRLCALVGPEEMLKREHLDHLRAALRERHGDFETAYYAGATATRAEVLDEVRTFSLLQPFKMVVVDDADVFLSREGNREGLERYAQAPVEQAVLVLRSINWRPGNLDKAIAKVGAVIKCEPLTRAAAQAWLMQRAAQVHQCAIDADAAQLLVERLGCDLMLLDSELGKLACLGGTGSRITPAQVREMVGRSSDETAWAIQEAILRALTAGNGSTGAGRDVSERTSGKVSGTVPGGRLMLEKVHEILDLAGHDAVPVYYAICDLMRKLCYAAVLHQKKLPGDTIARRVGVWGPGRDMVLTVARRVPPAQARRWLDRVMEMDLRNRTGLGDAVRNLEAFGALLADEI